MIDGGPLGPATDLLSDVRFELIALNDAIQILIRKANVAPQVTVEPAAVSVQSQAVDLAPLIDTLRVLQEQDQRGELQALRKEFSDLAVTLRAIASGPSASYGVGGSVVTPGDDFPVKNSATSPLHVTVDSLPAGGSSTDVTDRSARLLGHVTMDNPSVPVTDNGGSLTVDGTIAVSNFPATQPVSATTLPLPTGAALDSTLTGGSQKTKLLDSGGTNAASVDTAGALLVSTEGKKATYRVVVKAGTPVGSATAPFIVVKGSATKTVKITAVRYSASAATGVAGDVWLSKFSNIAGGTTGAAPTIAKADTNDAAATATASLYTAVPATATQADGFYASVRYETVTAGVSTIPAVVDLNASGVTARPLTLRGTSEWAGVGISAAGTTPLCDLTIEFTEE